MAGKKEILEAYMDACAFVREIEKDIQKLCRQEAGHTSYNPPMQREKEILRQRVEKAEKAKEDAERVIAGASIRMQRIIRYRVFDGLSWDTVAAKMGRGATAESVRKEYQRFLN